MMSVRRISPLLQCFSQDGRDTLRFDYYSAS